MGSRARTVGRVCGLWKDVGGNAGQGILLGPVRAVALAQFVN
jgi:hypothetical protein